MKNRSLNIFHSTYPKVAPERGRVLIADPFLQGPYFTRSIVLLTEHGEHGSVGFVINKRTDVYPDEVIDDLLSFDGGLYIGGPVASNSLHFLHTLGAKIPGAVKITPSIYWGGDFDKIKQVINSGKANSHSVRFFAGYAGWSPGQLAGEIEENAWIVASLDDHRIMQSDATTIWKESLEHLGDVYKTWSNFPTNPMFN